jgi:hypothetical protein
MFPNFLYTQSSEKPKLPSKHKPLFANNSGEDWESIDDENLPKTGKQAIAKEIFMTQQAEKNQENGNKFLTMNEFVKDSKERENGLTTFGNETDSKISINFNINNNYLLNNEIQNMEKGSHELVHKEGKIQEGPHKFEDSKSGSHYHFIL